MSHWLLLLGLLLNAAMDAIDHGKGARTLNYLWHFLKWLLFMPVLWLSGFFFDPADYPYWWQIPVWVVVGLVLWRACYVLLRNIFNYYGIPDWFVEGERN